jgi:hypothetical protein
MRIGQLADRLDRAADRMAAAAGALADVDPGAGAFGGDSPGRLGELGRALHQRLSTALTARTREAAAHAARLADSADALRITAERYRDAERAARSRHDIEGL